MTTSGTSGLTLNRDQIIGDALVLSGAIDEDATPGATMVNKAASALNSMIKHWQGTGIHIWTMSQGVLFLQSSQSRYTLGTGSTDHATTTFVQTALASAAAISASTISVDSIAGISTGDYVGVQVSDGTFQWTTVNGAPSGSTVTLTAALTLSAAVDAVVLTYTTKITRPLKIVSARRFNYLSGIETPLTVEDRETYFDLPLKTSTGAPNILFYDRRGGANTTGYAYLWGISTPPTEAVKFTWARPIEIFSTGANDADFPEEWNQTLVFNLAKLLAMSYGNAKKYALIKPEAESYLAEMQWNEKELVSVSFAPDMRYRAR